MTTETMTTETMTVTVDGPTPGAGKDAPGGGRAEPPALLVDARGAARMLGIGRSHLLKMHSSGRVPMPVKIGRRTLWRTAELLAWTNAGAPPRTKWTWPPKEA